MIRFLDVFFTTKFTKRDGYFKCSLVSFAVFLFVPCGKIARFFFLPQSSQGFTQSSQSWMGILSIALCPLWLSLCVPCGKVSSYFFYHKVHKDLHKVHKAGCIFSAKPCVPCGFFFVILVVKLLAIFSTTKFTRIYTKFTKLDG